MADRDIRQNTDRHLVGFIAQPLLTNGEVIREEIGLGWSVLRVEVGEQR